MLFFEKFSIIGFFVLIVCFGSGCPSDSTSTETDIEYLIETHSSTITDETGTGVDTTDYETTTGSQLSSSTVGFNSSTTSTSNSSTSLSSTTNFTDFSSTTRKNKPPRTRATKTTTTSTTTSTATEQPTSPIPPSTVAPVICNKDGSYDGKYDVDHWPPVPAGQYSIVECPHGGANASWLCLPSGLFDPNGPNWKQCNEWLDEIEESLPTVTPTVEKAIQVLEIISNKTTKNNTVIESEKLSQVLNIISKVQTLVENATDSDLRKLKTYTSNIVSSFNHIMDQKYAWTNSTPVEKADMASKILIGTQSSSYTLSLQQTPNNSVIEIHNNDFFINTFYSNMSSELRFPSKDWDKHSSIIIPSNTGFVNTTFERNSTALGAIIRNLSRYLSANMDEYHEINSDILSFSLTNSSEQLKLSKHIKIILKHKQRLQLGDKVNCVFWDFNKSKWSSDGCYIIEEESDLLHTVCKCNHLTNFAALMDVTGREESNLLKSVLTYVCTLISIVGLIFTLNLIIRSKSHSDRISTKGSLSEMRTIINCNLCICLLMTNILVIGGMDRTNILWLCQLSSASLLYSLLSSFFWMLMEGYYLYKSLVAVFNTEFKARYLYGLGYGLPIAILFVSFITIYIKEDILLEALFDERYNYFCWISSSHYPSHIWILIGPAVCVILSNCVLMFISLKTAYKILKNQSSFGIYVDKSKLKFKQIISFIFILFLLGITWLSFLFYINLFFAGFFVYVFIILNGSQGFFIFLYHLSIYDWRGGRRSNMSPNNSKF